MSFVKTAIAFAVAATALSANAQDVTTTYSGVNSHFSDTKIVVKMGGSFTDIWNFKIVEPLYSVGVLSNLKITTPLGSLYNISGLSVGLYSGLNGSGSLIDDLSDNTGSIPGQTFYGEGFYVPGNYSFVVSGNANGSMGGQYVFTATTAPVPEPETYAMLLAGLGVMGAIAVRRKKAKQD